jgi:SAM-dependent methyltransferase
MTASARKGFVLSQWARRLAPRATEAGAPATEAGAPGSGGADVTGSIWFPPQRVGDGSFDERLAAGGVLDRARCPACGYEGAIGGFTTNLRESGYCPGCGSWTRIRQLAAVLVEVASVLSGRPLHVLGELASAPALSVYNTEAHGAVHDVLHTAEGYACSEYFGPGYRSGEPGPGGTRHEDLQDLSFASGSLDLVISTDVFEHVPDPYRAHGEVRRVLRPGGHHVFTVPSTLANPLDDVRARVRPDGTIEHLQVPLYHDDPIRPQDGALVFTIFGLEMVTKLARLGFAVTIHRLWDPARGMVGADGVVFDAVAQG